MKNNRKSDKNVTENNVDLSDIEIIEDGANIVDDIGTFRLTEQTDGNVKKKSGLKKRLLITLIVIATLAVLTLVLYFAVFKPMYEERKEKENTKEPDPMIDGEVRDSGGYKILLYEYTDKASTNRITVEYSQKDGRDTFNLVRDENGEFYVKEHGEFKPVSETTVNNLVSAAGNPVITSRVVDQCDDLSRYGLDESDCPVKVTIENTDGKTNSFYIGNLIVSEGGYYCKAEGRSAVYILSTSDVSALLVSSDNLIEPLLGPVFDGSTALQMSTFQLQKNGQLFVSINYVESELDEERISAFNMTWPAGYVVNDLNYSNNVLAKIATAEGYMVIASGDGTEEGSLYNDPEIMAQYGFIDMNNPLYDVIYTYGEGDDKLWGRIIFAESGSDAYYYAY